MTGAISSTATCTTAPAEGIETAEQVSRLRALSCHYGQGYFFSEPLAGGAAGGLIQAGASW